MVGVAEATSATATFLFTDIAGSTQLLRSLGEDYEAVLADHDRLLREAFATYGGRVVDNQGDAFFVAFARAKDALLAAAAAQRALAAHSWPQGASVRVRIGIHTGEATLTPDRYVGLSVHRAARIGAVAHGGQVVVSQTTASLLEDEAALPGVELRDLGEHWLKDMARPVRLHELVVDGVRQKFPPLNSVANPRRTRRRLVLVAAAVAAAAAAAVAIAVSTRDDAPPEVVANSLVRLDPDTLEPRNVIPINPAPDVVVAAGGYVWITHHLLRNTEGEGVRNAGDRTVTRVDTKTGDVVTVGGGLAPCGLTPDPSGDVWVANCFVGGDTPASVVRVDARTLRFETTRRVAGGRTIYRGLTYGGGSLWVAEAEDPPRKPHLVTQVQPQTRRQQSIRIANSPTDLAWSGEYGDLWASHFDSAALTRIHLPTHAVQTIDIPVRSPAKITVEGDVVWVADWSAPYVARVRATGLRAAVPISLPARNPDAGVWSVATGEGYIWATTPGDYAFWRIDPRTNDVTRIPMRYPPAGVTTGPGAVWITVRKTPY